MTPDGQEIDQKTLEEMKSADAGATADRLADMTQKLDAALGVARTPSVRDKFRSHKLTAGGQHRLHIITEAFIGLADSLERLIPASPELQITLAKLQEAKMWANTGFVLHGGEQDEASE